ncbi:2Fe-2S iron-sulfur cluster binding domain-containing protein [Streptomyces sp. SID4985]|uniref:2Fe-2S iron-sulfur cluster-binding protein n=1 Tax=Streptomyces sp. SID4985 TaxID=2690292 RepID=UPI00136D9BD7|nr:2Fe-2S iron-sulfur cluster-binding protein [Streptomyces sp. SID4985]MYQ43959.1 2Fe-2S iron-sulfur cluster binding domain-containing protein [Streptomyces sp. SID4985]
MRDTPRPTVTPASARLTSARLAESRRMTTVEQVEASVGRPPPLVMMKQVDRLDEGCVAVLAHAPIAGFGYVDAEGHRRATFVGGRAGFLRVHSPERISLALPAAVAEQPPPRGSGVSFVFLLPGVGETLRVNGVVTGCGETGLEVNVREGYVHCGRSVLRSRLWESATMPRIASAVGELSEGPLCRPDVGAFLAASPFLVLSTGDASGAGDTSPRGDHAGFARVLDGHTLVLPDRKGNQRADTFHNLLEDDRIALAALVPGCAEVLRLTGHASITDDPALLETMSLRGQAPQAALLIHVLDAEVAHSDAVARSSLWSPTAHVDPTAVPNLIALASRHAAANPTETAGAPPALVMKLVAALASFPRLTRVLMDLGYRVQLGREGYGSSGRRRSPRRSGVPTTGRRMRVTEVRRETPHAVTLVLADARTRRRPVRFEPGQFFTLVAEIDGRTVRRAYSACSVPGSSPLEVTIKRVEDGLFSAYANDRLRAGDCLNVLGPSGAFRATAADHLVMIAAGSGVTPMMSMIRTRLAERTGPRLSLLYANRDASHVLFADALTHLQRSHPERLSVTHQLSRPSAAWAGARGRLTPETVGEWLSTLKPSDSAHYYLCGPEAVMSVAHEVLLAQGIPPERIHQESYTAASDAPPPPSAAVPHPLTVTRNGTPLGTTAITPGQTLLDGALTAGLPLPYSCTVGNCGECVVRLRTGEVAMSTPNCLTEQQRAEGYVLTCVGRPCSAVEVEVEVEVPVEAPEGDEEPGTSSSGGRH